MLLQCHFHIEKNANVKGKVKSKLWKGPFPKFCQGACYMFYGALMSILGSGMGFVKCLVGFTFPIPFLCTPDFHKVADAFLFAS